MDTHQDVYVHEREGGRGDREMEGGRERWKEEGGGGEREMAFANAVAIVRCS